MKLRRVGGDLRGRLGDSAGALRRVFENPNLRRLQLAWAGSILGGWAYTVALAVYAYRTGGATAVGLVGFARMLVSALAAPFLALLADRLPRRRVMIAADLGRAATLGAGAAAIGLSSPSEVVYALVVVAGLGTTAFAPARAALLPALARGPDDLAAANLASSTIESVGVFAGPALGGVLLAATDAETVFAVGAAACLWSAFHVARLHPEVDEDPEPRERGIVRQSLAGFEAIAREGRLRLIVGLMAAQTFVFGALNVFVVLIALRLLHMGSGGVGYLNSAVGLGGFAGSLVALALVGVDRLRLVFAVGIVLWGVPIALIGAWPERASTLALLAVVGLANTLVDVAGYTLLQRAVADDVLARVFGVLETLILASIAVGSVVTPPLVAALGTRGALVAVGLVLPALVILTSRSLIAVDRATAAPAGLAAVRAVPFLSALPGPVEEKLAEKLVPVHVAAGEAVVTQGEEGDRFYLVRRGELEVAADGKPITRLGPGGYFGEIALLRRRPRAATVTALTDAELLALGRDDFVAAVTGHDGSRRAADAVVAARLASLRPAVASL